MKKIGLKFALSCAVVAAIVALAIGWLNEVLVSKIYNRYYMLEQMLSTFDEDYEVQVYGSCHSYTSFDALYFEQTYGLTAFDLGNASEIIPTTYLRMAERFETDVPKVALVETWGINPYETYISQESIFGSYFSVNVECLPLSLRKLEVIWDFDSLDLLSETVAVTKYKDRLLDGELTELDFDYSFTQVCSLTTEYICGEMTQREENNGYKKITANEEGSEEMTGYDGRQAVVGDNELLEVEPDLVKYLDKIVELCEQYDVELIFYRAPYISTENELRKANWFAAWCEEKGVLYIDTEKQIDFEPCYDFDDDYHLNVNGARKVTDYLAPYILSAAQ